MILHEPELIEEYSDKGYWGDRTLLDRFAANRAAYPDREAVVDPPNRDELVGTPPQRLSWAEFGRAVDATAAELARRGFGKDDLLVAQLPNIWELAMLYLAAAKAGIAIYYGARADRLMADDDGVHGVILRHDGHTIEARSKAVVLACGGFEANPEWRTRYLGPGWDLAKVRGSRFNTGDGIRMALDAGAASYGNWSGCHAVAWDRDAPEFGDLAVGDGFQKHSYPLGIILNALGKRFVDEGADFQIGRAHV